MSREPCSRDESILRALKENEYDAENGRISSGAIKGKQELSVSRVAILPEIEIFRIFHRDLDRAATEGKEFTAVVAAARFIVGELISVASERDIALSVVEDPIMTPGAENPAHAVVLGSEAIRSRGVAKHILSKATPVLDPSSSNAGA